jgi:quinol-cytochrome oxidoreductase complex cytochrome b subunit
MSHTIVLLPFVFAFLVFALRFYFKEGAASMTNPSFLLALGTVLTASLYLVLGVLRILPPYSPIGFALIGTALLGLSIMRMFMI